jgi:hypothetical protein
MTKCAICNDYILTNEDVKPTNLGVAHASCVRDARMDGEFFDEEEDKGGVEDE